METELTKIIKRRLRQFNPAMNSNLRTIRWAEEVWTPTGIVDQIRFEDYIERDDSFCGRNKYYPETSCKIEGKEFPNGSCHGCVFKRNRHILGILTTCFEVKISVSDFKSKNGHNFCGNCNYYVVPTDIYKEIKPLVPKDIGIIVYYPLTKNMRIKKTSVFKEVNSEDLSLLLYNALKKWVDKYGMERLTEVKGLRQVHVLKALGYGNCRSYCDSHGRCADCEILLAFERLAAYEDTGTTPEEIKTLQEDNAKLQKLIDRDTAKRVDEEDCCPICNTYGKDDEGVQGEFCPNCGQRLDWGDDNA